MNNLNSYNNCWNHQTPNFNFGYPIPSFNPNPYGSVVNNGWTAYSNPNFMMQSLNSRNNLSFRNMPYQPINNYSPNTYLIGDNFPIKREIVKLEFLEGKRE